MARHNEWKICELESKQINLVYNEMTEQIQLPSSVVWFNRQAFTGFIGLTNTFLFCSTCQAIYIQDGLDYSQQPTWMCSVPIVMLVIKIRTK